ncbi:MAG: hypothetical protein LBU04_02080 [Christensenellaceae bacterium]|jgi:hypothetical protein|nr:hypothetical protein [Christensenellaceae bacterium]
MKLINREYGFDGRPPYYEDFFEESETFSQVAGTMFPEVANLAVSGNDTTLNDLFLIGKAGTMWNLNFSVWKNGKLLDSNSLSSHHLSNSECSKDFKRISADSFILRACKYSESSIIMLISAKQKMRIKLNFNRVSRYGGDFVINGTSVLSNGFARGVTFGRQRLTDYDAIVNDRFEIYDDTKLEYAITHVYGEGSFVKGGSSAIFNATLLPSNSLAVFFAVGDSNIKELAPTVTEIESYLTTFESLFDAQKVCGSGKFGTSMSLIAQSVFRHCVYNPYRFADYYINEEGDLNGLNYVFDSTKMLESSIVSALSGCPILIDQLIQNADDPILGPIAIWIAFCRTRDKYLLEQSYLKWLKTWTADTIFTSVNIFTKREIGFKMPSSPLKEIEDGKLYSLEFNSYKLIALDIMERASRILNRPERLLLRRVCKGFREKFNDVFFDYSRGLYLDRYLSGKFALNAGATAFIALAGGAAVSDNIVDMILINLRDSARFGGVGTVPTISKDNPSYGSKTRLSDGTTADSFENYSGSVLPRLNFLTYLGLVRLGANDVATEIADNSLHLFQSYYSKYGFVPAIMHPDRKLDSHATQDALSGYLMGTLALCELIDIEYFNDDLRPSIRFGTFAKGEHSIKHLNIWGHSIDILISNKSITLEIDGRRVFDATSGRLIVRNFKENPNGAEFFVYTKSEASISLHLPFFTKTNNNSYTFNIDIGRFKVIVDDCKIAVRRVSNTEKVDNKDPSF